MRQLILVVPLLALAACASAGVAEDVEKWVLEVPPAVDKGAEFQFTVRAQRNGAEIPNVKYHYQVLWPEGSGNPLRHSGWTGTAVKVHARMVTGKATIVFTCINRAGVDVKVAETSFEVK